jgi:biotin carboxyl carrier protein
VRDGLRDRHLPGLAAVVAVGALAPATLGLAWAVSRAVASPLRADAAPAPLILPVAPAMRDHATPVKVTVVPAAAREAKSAGPGLVTRVSVRVGQRVSVGDPVVAVNDRVRLAFSAPAPLWRDIAFGTRGADVARLQGFLTALGHQAGSTRGTATAATVAGIRALNRSLGYGASDGTLHRESLVWIGPEPLTVAEVAVRPGDTVGDGATLLRGPAPAAAVAVTEPDVFTPAGERYVLAVGDAQAPYVTGSLRVEEREAVAAIARALRGQLEGSGVIRLAAPERVGTLPVSAIVTDGDGRMCLFDSVAGAPIPVTPIGGSLSAADVPVAWIGRPVLANPRDVREDLSCG